MIANGVTVSRMLFSLATILFPPSSLPFAVLYVLCVLTDEPDGFLARKMHTESKTGEQLDSTADLFFVVVYTLKILPLLNVPHWIWTWTAIIAVTKITGIVIASGKVHQFVIDYSFGNKLTGLLLYLLPLSVHIADVKYGAILVCTVALGTVIKEMANQKEDHIL